jgi:MoaA/NifB/PqqE/SkfB family radical SAM enzyme
MALGTFRPKRRHSPGLTIGQKLALLRFGIDWFLLGKRRPLVAGVPLTDSCNLSCAHCVVKNGRMGHHSFERICGWIDDLYTAGARFLYLQGGEIVTWEDKGKGPNDVIAAARKRGFMRVAAVTNGTLPIDLDADAVWVSVDGPEEVHDSIRGEGSFAKLWNNVSTSSHPGLYANITLNSVNASFLEETVRAVEKIPGFRGMSINFHTPYQGVENLNLPRANRQELVSRILALKKSGHHILNSRAGLKNLGTGKYKRPIWMIRLVEQGRMFECCWGREQPGLCERCGYGIIAEMAAMAQLKPSAALQALSIYG